MIVCSCNVLSADQVSTCLRSAADCPRTPAEVYRCLGCSPQCGRCASTIRALMMEVGATPASSACTRSCGERCGAPVQAPAREAWRTQGTLADLRTSPTAA